MLHCGRLVAATAIALIASTAWARAPRLAEPIAREALAKPKGGKAPAKSAPAGMVEKSSSSRPSTREPAPPQEAAAPRGPTRIDFDDRLIQGQTNKSGAVYLFDRKELSVRSMVQQRSSFRDQIQKDVLSE
jgi:hypothetical protein